MTHFDPAIEAKKRLENRRFSEQIRAQKEQARMTKKLLVLALAAWLIAWYSMPAVQ